MNIKTLTIHSVRNVLAVIIALGIGYVAYTVNPKAVEIPKAQAAATALTGYAWSDTIGWISFNDTTGGSSAKPYGVNINTTTGDFSGEAWSGGATSTVLVDGGIGWISFDRAVTGNPPFDPYKSTAGAIAKTDTSGNVTGWARALSVCTQDASGNLVPAQCAQNSNAGGWDGWIKLSKDPSDTSSAYGVKIDPITGNFSGYAWGGAQVDASGNSIPGGVSVIGWIKFAASGNVPANSDDASCTGVTNDYSNTSKCTYGVKGPVLTGDCNITPGLCTGSTYCQVSSGSCVGAGGNCPSGNDNECVAGQRCNGFNICVLTGGSCNPANGNADCAGGQVCNTATNTCVAPAGGSCNPANGNADCVGGQICNTSTHLCQNKPKTTFWQF